MKSLLTVTTMLSVIFLSGTSPVLACECVSMSEEQRIDRHDIIFEGFVRKIIDVSDREYMTEFGIRNVMKGDGLARGDNNITSHKGGSAICGIDFEEQTPYKVFAKQHGDQYRTGLCSGTSIMMLQGGSVTNDDTAYPVP